MSRAVSSKVVTLDELAVIVGTLKSDSKKVVQCHGVFDMLHPGHIRHFEAAKKQGDVLVVTLTPDIHVNKGPGRPIFNQDLRADSVAALQVVDFVTINDGPTAVEAIRKLQPDLYVKGSDYRRSEDDLTGKILEEEEAVRSVGGVIHFTDEIVFSSSALINRHLAPYPEQTRQFLDDFRSRRSAGSILEELQAIRDVRTLVIGDIIIDEYHYVSAMGKSAKDHIIATRYLNEERFAGGVLAAANHLGGFCENVTLLTCLGTANDYGDFLESSLRSSIQREVFVQEGVPTVVKRRYVSPTFLTKLFEVAYLEQIGFLSPKTERSILKWLDAHVDEYDLVLVADFGHGLVTPRIVNLLGRKARFLALNVQSNSANLGFNLVTKYRKADYICIDEPEVRLASHDRESELEPLIKRLAKRMKCGRVVITRGEKGSLAYSVDGGFAAVPVLSSEVVDRVGAGDAFSAVTAPCALKGMDPEMLAFVGNAVGAMQVLTVGNREPVDPVGLRKYVTTLMK